MNGAEIQYGTAPFLKKIGTPVLTLLIIGAIVQIEQKRKQSKLKTADVLQLKADTVSYEAAQHK